MILTPFNDPNEVPEPTDHQGQPSEPIKVSEDHDKSKWSEQTPVDSRKAHTRSDSDLSHRSLHHTLGTKHNQASPGDHIHDGVQSKLLGPLEMDPVNVGKTRPQLTITANQWQTPAYTTSWAGSNTFDGAASFHPLEYILDGSGNVWFEGAFTVTASGAGASLFTLPTGYYDTVYQRGFLVIEKQATGTFQVGLGYVSTVGNFHIDLTADFTRNTGDQFYVNSRIPIGTGGITSISQIVALLHNFVAFREV